MPMDRITLWFCKNHMKYCLNHMSDSFCCRTQNCSGCPKFLCCRTPLIIIIIIIMIIFITNVISRKGTCIISSPMRRTTDCHRSPSPVPSLQAVSIHLGPFLTIFIRFHLFTTIFGHFWQISLVSAVFGFYYFNSVGSKELEAANCEQSVKISI